MSTTTTNLSLFKYNDDDDNLNFDYRLALNNNWDILDSAVNSKQSTLISGSNIKTINGESILGTGNLLVGNSAITVDSLLNSSSENPVQNKVLYPSLSKFIPGGTSITVKTDGTGDFNNLTDAISYLSGKWSNGLVTIKLGVGTFNVGNITIDTDLSFNFGELKIEGSGISETIINNTNQNGEGLLIGGRVPIILKLFTYKKPATTIQTVGVGIRPGKRSMCKLENVSIQGCGIGLGANGCVQVELAQNCDFTNCTVGVDCNEGGVLRVNQTNFTFNNCSTAWRVRTGGQIHASIPNVTYTSITNKTSQTVGTATNEGWITGITV